jgi:plastocyanin
MSRRWAAIACVLLAGQAVAELRAATLAVNFADPADRPIADAVVMVQELGASPHAAAPVDAVMDQVDLAFTPGVLAVPVGSRVSFPNSDLVSHQVYSFSATKKFQLPLYRGKPYQPIVFDVPGVVTLGCNIHDDMVGYIVVTNAAHYGVTNSMGGWASADLPPGNYEISIWHARLRDLAKPLKRQIAISRPDERLEVRVNTDVSLRPAPRTAKRADWDKY